MRLSAALFLLLAPVGSAWPAPAETRAEAVRLNAEGVALVTAGRYLEGVAKFRQALALLPDDETVRKNLGAAWSHEAAALLSAGKNEESAAAYAEASAAVPGDAAFLAGRGIALSRARRTGEAKACFSRALFLDEGCVPARVHLGEILFREGALRAAIREWERALLAEPSREDVRERLAQARRDLEAERDHSVEDGEHFAVSWDGGEDRSTGARVLRVLEDAWEEIGAALSIYPSGKVRVVLYGEAQFRAVTGAQEWVGGLFDGRIRLPVKDYAEAEAEVRALIFHEYLHVAVRSVTDRAPAWLEEGLACHFEGRSPDAARARTAAARTAGALAPLGDLREPFTRFADGDAARLAYAQSHAFVEFLLAEHGADRIGRFLRHLEAGRPEEEAAAEAFHAGLGDLFAAFADRLGR